MDRTLLTTPKLTGPAVQTVDGWQVETLNYRVSPRPKSKFKSILSSRDLFGGASAPTVITTRVGAVDGEPAFDLRVRHFSGDSQIEMHLKGGARDGLRSRVLQRTVTLADGAVVRSETTHFGAGPFRWPAPTYPEVLLPFLMRFEPHDKRVRKAYAWSSDRFCASVYYETRKTETVTVPAGRFKTRLMWMYPDLNDWISLGSVITKLAKPLLPRYSMWYEIGGAQRLVRYEGPYGPPGAPEIVIELI